MMEKIGDFLKRRGIALFGTGKPYPPMVMPAQFTARSIVKEAQSLLCYAVPIPKGIVQAAANFDLLYWRFCNMTYRYLDTVSNQLCGLIEERGYKTAPIYSCFPWKVEEKKFYGLLSLAHAAQQCGIGKITRSGLIGNFPFGTRLLLGGIATAAPLPETESRSGNPCPPDCFRCQDACPVRAISREGKVDHDACLRRSAINPLLGQLLGSWDFRDRYGFETLLNCAGIDDHAMYTCSECLRVCPQNA